MRVRVPSFVSCALLVASSAGARQGEAVVVPVETKAPGASEASEASDAPPGKSPVFAADYGKWESLGFPASLSRDGRWLAYAVDRTDGEDELRLRALGTEAEESFEYGSRAAFSEDSLWLGYLVGISEDAEEKLREEKKPVRTRLGLRDLMLGENVEVEDVASFAFSEDGRFLALRRYAPKEDDEAADLVVRELATGRDTCFGNVVSYEWCESAPLIAFTIEVAGEGEIGNGLQVYDAGRGRLRTLDSAPAKYVELTWREDAPDLACMRELPYEEDDDEDVAHVVFAWRELDGDAPRARTYDQRKAEGFPAELRVATEGGLRWAKDGGALFFGLKEWERKPGWARGEEPKKAEKESEKESDEEGADGEADEAKDGSKDKEKGKEKRKEKKEPKSLRESLEEAAGVEIWHARDVDVIPLQQKQLESEEREHRLAAWWLDAERLAILSKKPGEELRLLEGERHALALDDEPYQEEQRFGPTRYDVCVVDTSTGAHQKVLTGIKFVLDSSPDGRWFAYVQSGDVWVYDVIAGQGRNLSAGVPARFIDQEDSTLTDEKDPYGVAGWCVRSDELFLYDRYDLWMLPLDGRAAVRLTRGAEARERYRVLDLDPEDDEGLELAEPLYLSVYGDLSKKSGYARIAGGALPERLVWEDAHVGRLAKAEAADVYTYSVERYDDSPDLLVSGPELAGARQVTKTNVFQSEYLWGRSELVDTTNVHGEPLQGALFYPADYEPGKQYPMIVYIYELRSQVLHRYTAPTERNPYNTAVFSAEGYFVFQPDIVYRPQNPGLSAVECVEPAVRKVLETGMVDPERIGLVGHSWGAYQTAFIVTQTDLFAAGVAGAPLTNMMSMSMSMYWNSGQTDAWIFHESQGRMDRPFWQDVDTYIKNSPIFSIDKLNTPLMIAFGTEDGAVDFNQGVEMYNAARLAMKPFVMLVYPGENHGLRKKPNQVDYHHRVLEWFAHYLKGAPAPSWITDGQRWIDRKAELEEFERKHDKGKKNSDKGTKPERG